MKQEEYTAIIEIINKDVAQKNTEDLKKLRNYLNLRIEEADEQYVDVEACYKIMTMKLSDFLKENITGDRAFRKSDFMIAIKNITKLDSYDDIYVFDTIGISRKILLNENRIGNKTIDVFEDKLASHKIVRENIISINDRERLNTFRKQAIMKRKRLR